MFEVYTMPRFLLIKVKKQVGYRLVICVLYITNNYKLTNLITKIFKK